MADRKKYVFKTSEIAHLWAHCYKSQGQARNPQNNFYFTGDTLYSYRDSYPIARIVERKDGQTCVLIQTERYSNTTAKHISEATYATRHMTHKFFVPNVHKPSQWDRETDKELIKQNTDSYRERISAQEVKTMRSRVNSAYNQDRLVELIKEANDYCQFFGVRKQFQLTEPEALRERVRQQTAQTREENRRREESRKRQEAQAILEAQEAVEKWKEGTGYYIPGIIRTTYLRVEGEELVTSRGARIPVDHARRGLAFVRKIRQSGEEYQRNGHTFHLGVYAIDKIDREGNLTAGCHYITYAEIERIAPMLDIKTSEEMPECQTAI